MTSFPIPVPYGIKFSDWGAVVAEQLAAYNISPPTDENTWKTWASSLFYVQALTSRGLPHPGDFPDWQAWAERFTEVMR